MPKATAKVRRRAASRKSPLPPRMPVHPDGKPRVWFRLGRPARWKKPCLLWITSMTKAESDALPDLRKPAAVKRGGRK
ncbi:hypothetical protein DLREEDagr8_42720 [Dongia sp. agr-C8]